MTSKDAVIYRKHTPAGVTVIHTDECTRVIRDERQDDRWFDLLCLGKFGLHIAVEDNELVITRVEVSYGE